MHAWARQCVIHVTSEHFDGWQSMVPCESSFVEKGQETRSDRECQGPPWVCIISTFIARITKAHQGLCAALLLRS